MLSEFFNSSRTDTGSKPVCYVTKTTWIFTSGRAVRYFSMVEQVIADYPGYMMPIIHGPRKKTFLQFFHHLWRKQIEK